MVVIGEISILTGKAGYGLILTKLQLIMLRDLAIVFQRLVAAGFLVGAGKRHIANFQQLGCSKKRHVRRIVKEGIAQAALIHQNGAQAGALGLNGAGQTGRTGAHNQDVKAFLQDTTAVLHYIA